MYSLQIALHIGERAHTTLGVKSGGEGVRDHFGQKEEKSSKKWSLQNLYLRISREMHFGLLHGSCPKLIAHNSLAKHKTIDTILNNACQSPTIVFN